MVVSNLEFTLLKCSLKYISCKVYAIIDISLTGLLKNEEARKSRVLVALATRPKVTSSPLFFHI